MSRQISIPQARESGIGRVRSEPVNAQQNIDAGVIIPGRSSTIVQLGQLGERGVDASAVALYRATQQKNLHDDSVSNNEFNNASRELNPYQGEILSRKGAAAIGSYKEFNEKSNEIYAKYAANLQDERQKALFANKWNNEITSRGESISRFEAGQRTVYNIDASKGFVQQNINNALVNYTDPKQVKNAEANIIEETKKNVEGLSPEGLQLQLQGRLSALRTGLIDKLSTTQPYRAKALFDNSQSILTPEDRSKAENFLKQGADQAFYSMLEKDPVKANEMLDKGFFGNIVDAERKDRYRNAITTQVENMGRRAQVNQFLSTVKNEQQLFDSMVQSNRQDAFTKLYDYQKGFNADPVFVEETRNILLKSKGPTFEEKQAAITDLEGSFQQFKLRKVDGEYEVSRDTDFKKLIDFNRKIELNYLGGTISKEVANGYRKRITPALAEVARKEKGYDDIDLFDGSEDYDQGTQAINDYFEKNNREDDLVGKSRAMSRFIELQDQISPEVKKDAIQYNQKVNDLIKFVIEEDAQNKNPVFRTIGGAPNSAITPDGKLETIKGGPSTAKPTSKIEEDFTIRKGKDGNNYRIYKNGTVEMIPAPQQQSSNANNGLGGFGIISDANASEDTSGKVLLPSQRASANPNFGPSDADGMIEQGTIDLSVESPKKITSFYDEKVRGQVLIPTVDREGKSLSEQQAIRLYKKEGGHLGIFKTAEEANIYAKTLTKTNE